MEVTGFQENKSCSKVLNFLERVNDKIRCTHEETVGDGYSSVVRAPDSRLKGPGFKSL